MPTNEGFESVEAMMQRWEDSIEEREFYVDDDAELIVDEFEQSFTTEEEAAELEAALAELRKQA